MPNFQLHSSVQDLEALLPEPLWDYGRSRVGMPHTLYHCLSASRRWEVIYFAAVSTAPGTREHPLLTLTPQTLWLLC